MNDEKTTNVFHLSIAPMVKLYEVVSFVRIPGEVVVNKMYVDYWIDGNKVTELVEEYGVSNLTYYVSLSNDAFYNMYILSK